jgi:hypothetical protein
MKRTWKDRFCLAYFVIFALLTLYSYYSYFENYVDPGELTITNFKICGLYRAGESRAYHLTCGSEFYQYHTNLNMCGTIDYGGYRFAPTYYLYEEGERKPMSYGHLRKTEDGNFCQLLHFRKNHSAGSYTIKIYSARILIIEADFQKY